MRASNFVAAIVSVAVSLAPVWSRAEPAGGPRPGPAGPASPGEVSGEDVLVIELAAPGRPDAGEADASADPSSLAGAARRLTDALVALSGEGTSRAPLEDVLALAGCGSAEGDCLSGALEVLQVGRVVLGEVDQTGPDRLRVALRVLRPSLPSRQRSFELPGGDLDAMEAGFREQVGPFLRDPDAPPPPPPAPPRRIAPRRPLAVHTGFSARRVRPVTWAVTGAGVGIAALGGVLLFLASDKQSQIDVAPTATVEDLEALEALEDDGRAYSRWGTGLLVVGAVAAGVGAAFLYKQGHESPPVTVAPALGDGAVGAVLSIRLEGP